MNTSDPLSRLAATVVAAGLFALAARAQDEGPPAPTRTPQAQVTNASVEADTTKVTIAVEDADIHEVVSAIAQSARANIVVAPDVTGRLTLDLESVPWREALLSSVGVLGYTLEECDGILRVVARKSEPAPQPKRVFLRFEKADIRKVVQTIAKASGANLVVAPEVQGRITMRLQGVSWRAALDAAVETLGFSVDEDTPGILRIVEPKKASAGDGAIVTIAFEDADLRDVIDTIAKIGGANIAVAPAVKGSVSLRLTNVPWRDALESAVRTLGHSIDEDRAGILRIR